MKKLIRNAIRCKKCDDVIESKSVHDFQVCSCKACFVDGGLEYCRIGGNPEDIEFLTEYTDVSPIYHVEVTLKYSEYYSEFDTTDDLEAIKRIFREDKVLVTDKSGRVVYNTTLREDWPDV